MFILALMGAQVQQNRFWGNAGCEVTGQAQARHTPARHRSDQSRLAAATAQQRIWLDNDARGSLLNLA